jgi:hypothetical protein
VKEEIEIIFDEHAIFGPRVALWYPALRDTLRTQPNRDFHDLAEVMPPMPMFRNDSKFPPLQAADVIAWLFRNAFSGKRNQFEWIAEELRKRVV